MKCKFAKPLLFFASLSLLISSRVPAQEYIYSGARWQGNSVVYHVNSEIGYGTPSQQDWENAIDSAATQWDYAGANFRFIKGGDVDYALGSEPPGVYQLGYYYPFGNNDTIAYTDVTPPQNGYLTQVETYFNQDYAFSISPNSSQVDIWSLAAHELGHWLNLLDETLSSSSSNVMYENYTLGDTTHRRLTSDDEAGIQYIYGAGSWVVNNDITQSEDWYGNITVEPTSDGSDYINILDDSKVVIHSGCTVTLQPNVRIEIYAGDTLIVDGGSNVIDDAGADVDNLGGVYTGIGNGGGGGSLPPPPTAFQATIVGQNVILSWQLPSLPSSSTIELQLSKNPANGGGISYYDLSSSATTYTDVNGVSSLPVTYTLYYTVVNSQDGIDGTSSSPQLYASTAPSTVNYNAIWSGAVFVGNSVTVDSGSSLTIDPGTNVVFNATNGYNLNVDGKLSVQGQSGAPVTFTSNSSSPSSGDWGSIVLNGFGANGSTIDYADIDYGTQVDVENASNVEITNCNITANSGHGIYCYNSSGSVLNNTIANSNVNHGIYVLSSTVTCDGDVIYKTNQNQQGAGIQYSGSSGYIWRNDVDYYNWGIAAIWGSSPLWENVDSSGGRNNRITHCQIGVMVYQNSYPDIGEPYPPYGTSSIYDNDVDVALNTWYSTVSNLDAYGDYWNGGNPSNAIFQTGSGSSINVVPYVSTDFWSGFPTPSAQSRLKETVKPPIVASASPGNSPNATNNLKTGAAASFDSLSIGIRYLEKRRHKEAEDFFMSYLGRHPQAEAGYVYLYSCADSTTRPDIIKYFKTLPSQAAREDKLLLSNLYLREGDINDAKLVNDGITDSNPNTALAEKAELNNFYIALFNENDANRASSILKDVVQNASLSTPMEISDAEHALRMYVDPKTGKMPNVASRQSAVGVQPSITGLTQNYPNPFNPTTVISYNLLQAGNVTLTVYDVLGRKVMALVNGYQSAGIHSAEFNGDNLASGVYFYQLTAPGISQIKKMILLK